MMTEEPVRDVSSVELLRDRHREIKAEIDAREDVFADVVQEGRDMIDEKHFQSKEVSQLIIFSSFEDQRSQIYTFNLRLAL